LGSIQLKAVVGPFSHHGRMPLPGGAWHTVRLLYTWTRKVIAALIIIRLHNNEAYTANQLYVLAIPAAAGRLEVAVAKVQTVRIVLHKPNVVMISVHRLLSSQS
jgi:hypothetical protein